MAKSLDVAFDLLLRDIRSTPTETSAAASHRASISAKLFSEFGSARFFRTGSFGNGTNVSGHSDVDYFYVVPDSRLKADSAAMLVDIRASLQERFSTTQNIRVNGPAVQLPFGIDGAEHTEIVPVRYVGKTLLGFDEFRMPDSRGGWMFTAPESHKAYVTDLDTKLDKKLKSLIRLAKAWAYYNDVPLRSFFLEMFIANYASSETWVSYQIDLERIFRSLISSELSPLRDPRFVNDGVYIQACNTEAQRAQAIQSLQSDLVRIEAAREHNKSGRIAAAFDRWDLIFNRSFPNYSVN